MKFKELRQRWWFKTISNKYVLILLFFIVWMLFFDANSYLIHKELGDDITKLESDKTYFKEEISRSKSQIEKLKDSSGLETYARETYYMKRPDEEVYIIEYQDSLPKDDE